MFQSEISVGLALAIPLWNIALCFSWYCQMVDLHLHCICQLIVAQPDINSFNCLRFRMALYIPILESCPVTRWRKRAHGWDLANIQRDVWRERSSSSIIWIYISGKGWDPLNLRLEAAPQAKIWNKFINLDRVEMYMYVLLYKKWINVKNLNWELVHVHMTGSACSGSSKGRTILKNHCSVFVHLVEKLDLASFANVVSRTWLDSNQYAECLSIHNQFTIANPVLLIFKHQIVPLELKLGDLVWGQE